MRVASPSTRFVKPRDVVCATLKHKLKEGESLSVSNQLQVRPARQQSQEENSKNRKKSQKITQNQTQTKNSLFFFVKIQEITNSDRTLGFIAHKWSNLCSTEW